jgi:hypothetical protein
VTDWPPTSPKEVRAAATPTLAPAAATAGSTWPDASTGKINLWTNLFHTKEVSTVTKFDGDKNMTSRAPDITHVRKRTEKKTDIIDNNTLEAGPDLRSLFVAGLLVSNPRVLSHYVWGLLNTNLKDKTLEKHQSVKAGFGLESWRLMLQTKVYLTPIESLDMETLAQNPAYVDDGNKIVIYDSGLGSQR